ncbi:Hematopoietic lineage cell-specific protein [Clonorchis sinensis]|uniref:Hematopoietic lineage cell-specific protein n=1 Tax=Clonorchis sinensis TaxID=79923 RepID=A0A8T1N0W9_CLOSI|nr:Hematopoietic lineage cell-specific protein [Clonorchis sinensis]
MVHYSDRVMKYVSPDKLRSYTMGDDWETEPDFVNDVSEKEQRWGSKTVPGSGRQAYIDMNTLREEVKQADQQNKLKTAPKPSYGYGGKFGVERDRMDKSAVGWDHREQTAAHPSQTDYAKGFGGKYGVQTDRMDTTAGADQSKEPIQLHPSQMRPEVRGQAGGISSLRSQFETKGQTTASPASGGPTAAQMRVSEERARWETERSKAAANAPSTLPEVQPTHEPQREPVQEPTREMYPESEPEPAVDTTEPVTEHMDQVSELPGSGALPQCTVVALYDYTAEEADELTFSVGELITEVEKIDPGWWKGVCRDKVGIFPSNYVEEQ